MKEEEASFEVSWSDDEFEVPNLEVTSAMMILSIGEGERERALEADDWHQPHSKVVDHTSNSATSLLRDTSVQAVYSLNTPACRKKRRCILCTRPIASEDSTVLKCARCLS